MSSPADLERAHAKLLVSVVALVTLSLSCRNESAQPRPPATRESSDKEPAKVEPDTEENSAPRMAVFPSFGVQFRPPEGWSAEQDNPPMGFLARWTPADAGPDDWSQFTAQMTPVPQGLTADQAAASFEQRGYKRSAIRLGGGSAVRLDAPPQTGSERSETPSPIVVAVRGKRLWRLIFLLDDPSDDSILQEVTAAWQWLPLEPAGQHLQLGKPQPLFSGLGSIRLPQNARVDAQFHKGDTAAFIVYDYKALQDAIVYSLERFPAAEKDSLASQCILYAERIEENTGIKSLIEFQPIAGRTDLRVSDVVQGDFQLDGKTVSRLSIYGMWRPDKDNFVRMQVVINSEVIASPEATNIALKAIAASLASCATISENGSPDKQ